jgi:Tol biopolymer transport system component
MSRAMLLAALVAVGGCGGTGTAMPRITAISAEGARDEYASFSPDGSQVAFWRPGEKGSDLWVARADMSSPRSLGVSTLIGGFPPVWSPDGRMVAVPVSTQGLADVAVVQVEDGTVTRLTDNPGLEVPHQFHPDGDRVLYWAATRGSFEAFTVSRSTREIRPLLKDVGSPYIGEVSPDGQTIIYERLERGKNTVWMADADGGNRRQLTQEGFETLSGVGALHRWSPDGKQFLYQSNRTGKLDIWVASITDGTTRQLTTDIQDDRDPAWSPDGRWIAFLSSRGRQLDVWVMPAAGGDAVRITDDPIQEEFVNWIGNDALGIATSSSPGTLWTRSLTDGAEVRLTPDSIDAGDFWISDDRSRIALLADQPGGTDELAVMAAGGGDIRIVDPAANHRNIEWSPGGKSLAFTSDRAGTQDLWVADPNGAAEARQVTDWPGDEAMEGWSADGANLYFTANRDARLSDLWKTPLIGGAPERLTEVGAVQGAVVSWPRESREILLRVLDEASGEFSLARRQAGGRIVPFGAGLGNIGTVIPSPDGTLLAMSRVAGQGQVGEVVRFDDGATVATLPPAADPLGFSPDGTRLLYGFQAGPSQDLGILDVATGQTTRVTTTPESESHAEFTADGNSVILRRVRITRELKRADIAELLKSAGR